MPRRKTLLGLGGLSAVLALLAGGTAAQAAPVQVSQSFDAVATAPSITVGDRFVVADQDVAGGGVIGHDVLSCTVVAGGSACDVAFAQPGGLLYARFALRDADGTLSGSVTGGTGRFCHAHGRLTGTALSPTDVHITLHYTR